MMNKFRKMQETWLSKFILILTAVSFMSLFGVSGYILSLIHISEPTRP